jgi:hypothetical protein
LQEKKGYVTGNIDDDDEEEDNDEADASGGGGHEEHKGPRWESGKCTKVIIWSDVIIGTYGILANAFQTTW